MTPLELLLFLDDSGLGTKLKGRFELAGHEIVTVTPSSNFDRLAPARIPTQSRSR